MIMSLLILCSIYDTKVGAFAPPFCAKAKGEAMRSFQDALGDPQLPFGKHPADFVLYVVAVFNDQDGRMSPTEMPERLIAADEFSST
jgi:hypothetical protein